MVERKPHLHGNRNDIYSNNNRDNKNNNMKINLLEKIETNFWGKQKQTTQIEMIFELENFNSLPLHVIKKCKNLSSLKYEDGIYKMTLTLDCDNFEDWEKFVWLNRY